MTEPKTEQPKKQTKAQRLKEKRQQRKPLTGRIQKLQIDIPDGFAGRWFNDVGPRIQNALAAGWEFIDPKTQLNVRERPDDMGSVVRERVDKKLSNEPIYAYLMVIEKELYDEDQASKMNEVLETDRKIVKGDIPNSKGAVDGDLVYVKKADLRGQAM